MFITFIYRVGKSPKTYYGKYCDDYISDDHEGLDTEVIHSLCQGLNKYRSMNNMPKLSFSAVVVGVLSFSRDHYILTFSSEKEIPCFDFYRDEQKRIYINGKLI
jgi:hypothetical protein